jgi:hypothetical protein
MTAITRIELRIKTVNQQGAGTDADIYLGLAGREFHVDSPDPAVEDFEPFSPLTDHTYIFDDGTDANVADPKNNDPTAPWQIDSDDIDRCPTYIRLEESKEHANVTWNVEFVRVVAKDKSGHSSFHAERLGGGANLWMGAGKKISLSRYLYF